MRIIPGILLLSGLFFSSCSEKEKKPSGILPVDKMREVMWDMVRADEYVTDFLKKDSGFNKKDESTRLYEQVFRLHKITREQFKKSLDYYGSAPDLFQPIIDSVAKKPRTLPPVRPFQPDTSKNSLPGKELPKQ